MADAYNPANHSIVQACEGSWEQFECDDFVEALLESILAEIVRVHWNVFQHQWGPTWNDDEVEDPQIPGIAFVRYFDDLCDCGGIAPLHVPDCQQPALLRAWNERRLDAITDSTGCMLFFSQLESEFLANNPRPTCACEAAWDRDRGCLDTCIGQRPNFQHEDVCFKWYKRPGRGMSTNKNWTAEEWRSWHARCLATIRAFDARWDDPAYVRPVLVRPSGSA